MRIESREQFEALRAEARARDAGRRQQVLVCCGTGCLASGAKKVAEAFRSEIAARGLDAEVGCFVKTTGCHGFCERGPLVALQPSGVLYTKVRPKRVSEIVEKTLLGGEVIPGLLYKEPVSGERIEIAPVSGHTGLRCDHEPGEYARKVELIRQGCLQGDDSAGRGQTRRALDSPSR